MRLLPLLALAACGYGTPNPRPTPSPSPTTSTPPSDELVLFSTDESMRRLERSRHKVDFFRLANQFEGQEHGGMCGPTSAVIVLNTLRIPAADQEKPAYRAGFPEKYAPVLARLPPTR
ncbi:MAG TPA: phytochelatin synthase family protein, partial [Kofleriaceae bacterium]|nr:phytochelatin synthase family protein [Kofleriaceae bacterium]